MISVERCPICESESRRPFERVELDGARLDYSICLRCGHVYQAVRMTEAELEAYYKRDYQELVRQRSTPAHTLAIRWARALWFASDLQARGHDVRRHLDIGSAGGEMLWTFEQAFGCRSVGVEKNEAFGRDANDAGLTTYADVSNLKGAGEARFDLITLAHSLEHLPDPVGYLQGLKETLLERQGGVMLEVPNLFGHASYEVPHVHCFYPRSLRNALARAGFRVEVLRAHGSYRSPILQLYITALARPSDGDRATLRRMGPARVRLGRWMGMKRKDLFTRLLPDWTWRDPREFIRKANPLLLSTPAPAGGKG